MFILAVSIGILSYALMGLGLVGWLNKTAIYAVLASWLLVISYWLFPLIKNFKLKIKNLWLWVILAVQMLVNLVGALGPELGFDALWYHLPIPQTWLYQHEITFLGGNLYYSGLSKLIDMLYVYPFSQLIHYGFGILILLVIYKLARKYLNNAYSLLACVIFYSNLVVGWQSITSYIDLGRTFLRFSLSIYLLRKNISKLRLLWVWQYHPNSSPLVH